MSAEPDYSLRPATPEDASFLFQLYSEARPDLAILGAWPEDQREAFLRNQFELQQRHYETSYEESNHDIILVDGAAVGRVSVDWREDELRGLDISIVPEHRRRGLGGRIMRDLKAQASERGVPFTLCVEHNNPDAKRFYERHGCRPLEDIGMHLLMEWAP